MADLSKATPRPWRKSATACYVCNDFTGPAIADCFMRERPFEERDANAALIVHCVNLHDELVAALREIVDVVENGDADPLESGASIKSIRKLAKLVKVRDAARAALAKANER